MKILGVFILFLSFNGIDWRILDEDEFTNTMETDDGIQQDEDQTDMVEEEITEEIPSCNNALLYSVGVLNSGYRNERSILCSNVVNESCCSKTSEKIILNQWNNNNKLRIKQYIEGYLWLFKVILNYYDDFLEKAKEIKNFPQSPTQCVESANNIISNYIDKQIMKNFVLKLEKSFQHLAFVRKSFYCVLCSTNTQGFFNIKTKEIIYANKFCENLVESTIDELFTRSQTYMSLFNDMNQIIDCDPDKKYVPDVYQIDMRLSNDEEIAIQKCYKLYSQDQDPRVYLSGCLDYCKKFSITGAKEVFEGHFGKLLYIYNKIKSANKKPSNPIYTEFDTNVEFDFSFVGPEFFENLHK